MQVFGTINLYKVSCTSFLHVCHRHYSASNKESSLQKEKLSGMAHVIEGFRVLRCGLWHTVFTLCTRVQGVWKRLVGYGRLPVNVLWARLHGGDCSCETPLRLQVLLVLLCQVQDLHKDRSDQSLPMKGSADTSSHTIVFLVQTLRPIEREGWRRCTRV